MLSRVGTFALMAFVGCAVASLPCFSWAQGPAIPATSGNKDVQWVLFKLKGSFGYQPEGIGIAAGDPVGLSELLIDDRSLMSDRPASPEPDPWPAREFTPEKVRSGSFFRRDWSKLFEPWYQLPEDSTEE